MPLRRCAGSSVRVSAASTPGCARSRPNRTALRRRLNCAGTSAASLRPSAGSMAHPGSTLNCAERGTGTRDTGSNGSCATWVCRPREASAAGPKPRTAATTCRLRPICSAAPLWLSAPTPCGWPTSRTFQPMRASLPRGPQGSGHARDRRLGDGGSPQGKLVYRRLGHGSPALQAPARAHSSQRPRRARRTQVVVATP